MKQFNRQHITLRCLWTCYSICMACNSEYGGLWTIMTSFDVNSQRSFAYTRKIGYTGFEYNYRNNSTLDILLLCLQLKRHAQFFPLMDLSGGWRYQHSCKIYDKCLCYMCGIDFTTTFGRTDYGVIALLTLVASQNNSHGV